LLEIIIYITILTMMLAVVTNSSILLSSSFVRARISKEVSNQGRSAMERMMREVRLASEIVEDGSVLGTSPGTLKLNTVISSSDDTPQTLEFFVRGPDLIIKEGGGQERTLTSGIKITNLVFYKITASSTSQGAKIEFTAEKTNGKYTYSGDFSGTAVLRGSY